MQTDHDLKARLQDWRSDEAPQGLETRLIDSITALPQKKASVFRAWLSLENVSFGLRHDMRYQLAAGCACLILSLGVAHGLRPTADTPQLQADQIDLTIAESDPVLGGTL